MLNKRWEALIPFYVAGTLSKQEVAAFEKHLATCAECRFAIEEWKMIASAVRAEAASQLRDLPPLAPALQAQISGAYANAPVQRSAYGSSPTAQLPPLNIPLDGKHAQPSVNITRMKQTRISFPLPFTLAASAAMVLFFALVLANMTMNQDQKEEPTQFVALSAGSGTPEITDEPIEIHQTVALTATYTPIQPTQAVIFATSTPSHTPTPRVTSNALQTIIAASVTQQNDTTHTPNESLGAQIIVSSTTINLRQGPSTDYPILEMGEVNNRYNVLARVGSGANTWYQVERASGGTAWVFGTIVRLEPANAQIPLAANIPPPPIQPTATPTTPATTQDTLPPVEVSPTLASAIRGGDWTHLTTIAEHQCGGETGISQLVNLFILPSVDLSSLQVTYMDGTTFTLYRANSFTYTGSYSESITEEDGTVLSDTFSVSIIFNTPSSYTGQETILYDDGCIMRSTWNGTAGN